MTKLYIDSIKLKAAFCVRVNIMDDNGDPLELELSFLFDPLFEELIDFFIRHQINGCSGHKVGLYKCRIVETGEEFDFRVSLEKNLGVERAKEFEDQILKAVQDEYLLNKHKIETFLYGGTL